MKSCKRKNFIEHFFLAVVRKLQAFLSPHLSSSVILLDTNFPNTTLQVSICSGSNPTFYLCLHLLFACHSLIIHALPLFLLPFSRNRLPVFPPKSYTDGLYATWVCCNATPLKQIITCNWKIDQVLLWHGNIKLCWVWSLGAWGAVSSADPKLTIYV